MTIKTGKIARQGDDNMNMNYVTVITEFENRGVRHDVKLKKGYKVNHKPYDIMKERYLELMQVLKELSHLLNTDDYRAIKMHWEAVERITGSTACGYCKHVLYHNKEHRSNTKRISREYISKAIYNKVIYWNIYNNNSRYFLVVIDPDDLVYEASSSVNINRYSNRQTSQFIKALMGTDALVIIKDPQGTVLAKYSFHKDEEGSETNWDLLNYDYNEIVKDLIYNITQDCGSAIVEDPKVVEVYSNLMRKYQNLDMSERLALNDKYGTRLYFNTVSAIREVNISTYTFLKDNKLLEERVDVEEVKAKMLELKDAIKEMYPKDRLQALRMFNEYEKLEASTSREYSEAESVGYNDTISEDFGEDPETVVMNHETNDEIASYTDFMNKY